MRRPTLLLIASVSGFISVTLGAFGAHILKAILAPDLLQIFQTGVQYQFYHSLVLLALAFAPEQFSVTWLSWAGRAFTFGILIFSGSLYLLALTGERILGAVTPIGGVGFLCGWGLLIYAAIHAYRR